MEPEPLWGSLPLKYRSLIKTPGFTSVSMQASSAACCVFTGSEGRTSSGDGERQQACEDRAGVEEEPSIMSGAVV